MVSFGKIQIGKFKLTAPAVAASIIGEEVASMKSKIPEAIGDGADIIELRLDGLSKMGGWEKMLQVNLPVIVTNRPKREGGKFSGKEADRLKTLAYAIEREAPCVDIELSTKNPQLKKLIRQAKEKDVSVILSYHNLKKTPAVDFLINVAKRARDEGCDIVKIVTFAKGPKDALRVLDFLVRAREEIDVPLIAFAMGEAGRFSRIVAPMLGSPIVYASVDEATAPGQLKVSFAKMLLTELRGP
ncbi:MAG: hypothetical protein APU95_05800 [Hadesarchaea archaeon YNP_N21]|jgi:3-dehydroquinate dehydratase-1|nr:MAG: hypothetical protein APU95_05800 [Hadesarchaea archaeon YNP_N21]